MLPTACLALVLSIPVQEPAAPQGGAPLVVGQPAPDLAIERWVVEPKPAASLGSEARPDKKGFASGSFAPQRWSSWHEARLVVRAGASERNALLADLASACADRELVVVAWTSAAEEAKSKELVAALGEKVWLGVPKPESVLGELAPEACVIGPSGELVWTGALKEEKALLAAVAEALERPKARPLGAPLARELAPVLSDYWKGSWSKARAAADKLAKKPAEGDAALRVQSDAKRVVVAIDELEKDLGDAARDAAGKSKLAELVEIESLLVAGLPGAVQKRVSEAIQEQAKKSMLGGTADDARKWLDLAARRPLFFPAREDGGGERYAHDLEQFVKRSANNAGPQQRALTLIERWKQRKAR